MHNPLAIPLYRLDTVEIYFDQKRDRLPEYIPVAKLFEKSPKKKRGSSGNRVGNDYNERMVIQKNTDDKLKQLISVVPQVCFNIFSTSDGGGMKCVL